MGSESRQKTVQINFRCTPEEKQHLEEMAQLCSTSVSDYCRNLSLGNTPKSTIDSTHFLTVAKIGGDLGRIGGLLKLWLGTDSKSVEAKELNIRQVMRDLNSLRHQVNKLLLNTYF